MTYFAHAPAIHSYRRMLRNCLVLVAAIVIAAGQPGGAWAKTSKDDQQKLDAILAKMQKVYDETKSYTADFEQYTGSQTTSKPQMSKGTVAFSKPGKMRWDYSIPPRAFISDATTFWMVQHDRKEIVEAPVKDMFGTDTPMAFLSGFGELRKEFDPSLERISDTDTTVKLALKEPTNQAQYLLVTIDNATGLAKIVKTVDFFGAYNELRFANYRRNVSFAADHFTLGTPQGYKILHPTKSMPSATGQ